MLLRACRSYDPLLSHPRLEAPLRAVLLPAMPPSFCEPEVQASPGGGRTTATPTGDIPLTHHHGAPSRYSPVTEESPGSVRTDATPGPSPFYNPWAKFNKFLGRQHDMPKASGKLSSRSYTRSFNTFTEFDGNFCKVLGEQYEEDELKMGAIVTRAKVFTRIIALMEPQKLAGSMASAHIRCKGYLKRLADFRAGIVDDATPLWIGMYNKQALVVDASIIAYCGNWAFRACLRDRLTVHMFITSDPKVQEIIDVEPEALHVINRLTLNVGSARLALLRTF